MQSSRKRIGAWALFGAGLACAVAGAYLGHRFAFSGELLLRAGGVETLVVRAAASGAPPDAWANATRDALPFQDPKAAAILPADARYDGVPLPFALTWQQPPKSAGRPGVLYAGSEQAELCLDLPADGESTTVAEGLALGAHYPWPSLKTHHSGAPMAQIQCRPARSGIETRPLNLFLVEGLWQLPKSGPTALLSATTPEAPMDAPERLDWRDGAFWGVEDQGALQQSTDFQPGSGWSLATGQRVTLESVTLEAGTIPFLQVSMDDRNNATAISIEANSQDRVNGIRFGAPAVAPESLRVTVLPDGGVRMAAYAYGARIAETTQQETGNWWRPPGGTWDYRFEGASRRAVPVTADESKRWALEYAYDETQQRIVEEEARHHGELRLRLGWGDAEGFALSALSEAGTPIAAWQLDKSQQAVRYRGWHFAIAPASDAAADRLIVTATRGARWDWAVPGGLLAMAALFLRRRWRDG